MSKIKQIIKYKYTITLETGLHIGRGKDNLTIGGTDSPVIVDFVKLEDGGKPQLLPIIPGSSIKGKIRSLLELTDPNVTIVDKENYNRLDKEEKKEYLKVGENYIKYEGDSEYIPKLFGVGAGEEGSLGRYGLPRLIVRDAFPTKNTIELWEKSDDVAGGTIIKTEATINRLTSHANPRQIERVPAGSEFEVEFILLVFDNDDKDELEQFLEKGIKLLEENYLGGSGTRGYGKVKFSKLGAEVVWPPQDQEEQSDLGDQNV